MGIGGAPHASAALDVKASNKAFYAPRLTTSQRTALIDPQPGALVYDLNQKSYLLYNGATWSAIAPRTRTQSGLLTFLPNYNNTGTTYQSFGKSVALTSFYALVGSPQDYTGNNKAYIFKKTADGWAQVQTLKPPDGDANADYFGYSVAMTDDFLVIGAPLKSSTGAAYVYVRSGGEWVFQQKLLASDRSTSDQFGSKVALTNNLIVVSSPKKGAYQGGAFQSCVTAIFCLRNTSVINLALPLRYATRS